MKLFKTTQEILNNDINGEIIDIVFNQYGGSMLRNQYRLFTIDNLIIYRNGYKRVNKQELINAFNHYKLSYLDTLNSDTRYTYNYVLADSECTRIIANILENCKSYAITKCEISGLYFDKNSVDYLNYYEGDNLGYCLTKKAEKSTEHLIIGNDAFLLSECVEMIIGNDGAEPIRAMRSLRARYYVHNNEYYTHIGAIENDLVIYDNDIYELDDCVFCVDTDNYVPVDYAHYYEETEEYFQNYSSIEEKDGLRGYHRSDISDKSNNSEYKIGFEIEKEDADYTTFRAVRNIGWDAESDGSLDDDGFELISPIYNLNNMDAFNSDMQKIANYINADSSSNCGGHINVSVRDKNAKEIFSLIQGYTPLLYAMFPTRIENRYCKAKKLNEFNDRERYEAINLTKGNILEFRIFSRVKNVTQLTWRYKFIRYMFNNQRKGAASIVRMLLTDSKLKALLLDVYSLESYNKLVERVIKFTDVYMSARDIKTTSTLITKMKQGEALLSELTSI